MSDSLKHECGIALVRLKHPLQYYVQKYGSVLHGFHKLFLLMEKQHNRGQDGAGIGVVKLGMPPGHPYMFRDREIAGDALVKVFGRQQEEFERLEREGAIMADFASTVKDHFPFAGEVLIGHLRYGTSGGYGKGSCHPYFRRSTWPTKSLMVLGNFNMTNTEALNQALISRGQHPVFDTDTQTILEEIGYHLDAENTRMGRELASEGVDERNSQPRIASHLDLTRVLREAAKVWDGGYAIAGLVGSGDSFVLRDPSGIRPAHWVETEDYIAVASERVPLMTVFEVDAEQVHEVKPGHVLVIKANGEWSEQPFADPQPRRSCSFERIYFSRGNDPEIYRERKALGEALVPRVLETINHNLEQAVFGYIPNTAETAYFGLLRGLRSQRRKQVKDLILAAARDGTLDEALLDEVIMRNWPRGEKIALKDAKLRTFISQERSRHQLVSHVYDVTYGVIGPEDTLVVLDDSIVRGTTLRQSIIRILARTLPKRIVIVSTAPQIRYPDCYGIDMAELGKFIAFQAAVALLKERGRSSLLEETAELCREEVKKPAAQQVNLVKRIYAQFTDDDLAAKIAQLVTPTDLPGPIDVTLLFQTVADLHTAIPDHRGDWYFTGDYPTPGGFAFVNRAFLHFIENKTGRAYDVRSFASNDD